MRATSIGAGSHSFVDSLTVSKTLPVWDSGTSRLGTLSPAKIWKIFKHWITEMTLKISAWEEE
eukprot:2723354-Prorocentrum_lima.AAC.1